MVCRLYRGDRRSAEEVCRVVHRTLRYYITLSAMERSVVKDIEIKVLLKEALTDRIHDRVLFMKGIDVSYFYEGYSQFDTEKI